MTARLVLPANHVEVFDTTLRDGMQVEGVSASVVDKLRIAEQLDHLGVHYIEGGWPGANPKDEEFFARAKRELKLSTSRLVAFGSTRRPRGKVDDDLVFDAATLVNEWRKQGTVLVHCQAGLNRSGLVTATALVLDGWDPAAAIAHLRDRRGPAVLCNPDFEAWVLAQSGSRSAA